MKKIVCTTILFLFVTGCSSFSDLRKRGPDKVFTSLNSNSPKAVAECILFGWQDHTSGFLNYGETYIQPYGDNGYTVFSDARIETADVFKEGDVVKINFFEQGGAFQYRINARLKVIEKCIG